MPIAMPAAPYASAATRPRPSKKPPAAITGMADRVDDLRQQQRRRHRAGVAAALAALHDHRVDAPLGDLLGVALGADRRHDDARRASLQLPRSVARSAPGRSTPPSRRSSISRSTRSSTSAASARRFTPNGLVGARPCTSRIAAAQLGRGHRGAGEDAEPAGRARSPTVRRAPGDPAHAGLHDRVLDAEQVADAACAGARCISSGTSWSRRPVRVDDLADQPRAPRRSAARRLGHVVGDRRARSRWPRRPRRRSRRGARERSRMRWSGVSKSSTREVGDDAAELVVRAAPVAELGGAVVADAGHDVDLRDEHASASGSGSSSSWCC